MSDSLESPRGSLVSSGRTKPSALKHQHRMNSSAPSSLTRSASSKEQPRPHSLGRDEPARSSLGAGPPSESRQPPNTESGPPPVSAPASPPAPARLPASAPFVMRSPLLAPASLPAAARAPVAHRPNLSDDFTLTASSTSSAAVRPEAAAEPGHTRAELDVSSLDLEAEWCHFNAQKRHLKHAHSFQPGSEILQACTNHANALTLTLDFAFYFS